MNTINVTRADQGENWLVVTDVITNPGVTGNKARTTDLINWYIGHVQRAATRDEQVCRALLGVTGLLAPPATLFRPKVALRVLRHSLARRGAAPPAAGSELLVAEDAPPVPIPAGETR